MSLENISDNDGVPSKYKWDDDGVFSEYMSV